jgi:hypothetical protein
MGPLDFTHERSGMFSLSSTKKFGLVSIGEETKKEKED